MAGLYDVAPQQGVGLYDLPSPGATTTPEQLDVQGTIATSGSAHRGFRSGLNSVGSMLNNLVGQSAEAVGLTEFAKDRFEEAKRYASFADAVGPAVRDLGQIHDFTNLVDFVAGHAGSGVATTLLPIATGLGFRRKSATLGAATGASLLEAGEQVGTLRDNPNVMATTDPAHLLQNAAMKGIVGGAFETVGAGGQAARTLTKAGARLRDVPKAALHGIVGEAGTEAAQDVSGQLFEQQLDPTKKLDLSQTANAAAAGAAGGGAIAGGAKALAVAPGKAFELAKSASELRDRIGQREAPPDPFAVPEEALNPNTPFDRVMELVGQSEDAFAQSWEKIKSRPEFAELRDVDITDPETLTNVWKAAKDHWNKTEVAPKIKGVLSFLKGKFDEGRAKTKAKIDERTAKMSRMDNKGFEEAANDALNEDTLYDKNKVDDLVSEARKQLAERAAMREKGVEPPDMTPMRKKLEGAVAKVLSFRTKKSEQRTQVDVDIHKKMLELAPQEIPDAATPEQLLELSGYVAQMARDPEAASEFASARVLRKVMGPKFKELMDYAIERVQGTEETRQAGKDMIRQSFDAADGLTSQREAKARDVMYTHLRPGYLAKPELLEPALDKFVPQMLDYLDQKADSPPPNPAGAKGVETPGSTAERTGTPGETKFRQDMAELFEHPADVLDALDEITSKEVSDRRAPPRRVRTQSEAFQAAESASPDTGTKGLSEEDAVAGTSTEGGAQEDIAAGKTEASKMAEDPRSDRRFGVPIGNIDEARKTMDALRQEYHSRTLGLKLESLGDGRYIITAEDADQMGLDEEALKRVREGPANRSGLNNGVVVVMTVHQPTGIKISLPNLTREMMIREGQQTREGRPSYVADMFARGLSALLATETVKDGKRVPLVTGVKLPKDEQGNWSFPDDAKIAVTRKQDPKTGRDMIGPDGKPMMETWTYKAVREAGFGRGRAATLRKAVSESWAEVGAPKWGAGKEREDGKIGPREPQNDTAKAVTALSDYYNGIADGAQRVGLMENDAATRVGDKENANEVLGYTKPTGLDPATADQVWKETTMVGRRADIADRIKEIEKVKNKALRAMLATELAQLRDERRMLDAAVGRVEREAELLKKPDPTADERDELNALQEKRDQRGAWDEETGAPLHQQPAQGPRGEYTGKEGGIRTYVSETEAGRRAAKKQDVSGTVVSDENMRKALNPNRPAEKFYELPELTDKRLPEPAYDPELDKRSARYAAQHPQSELPMERTGATGLAKHEAELGQKERERKALFAEQTRSGKPVRQKTSLDALQEMIEGRKIGQELAQGGTPPSVAPGKQVPAGTKQQLVDKAEAPKIKSADEYSGPPANPRVKKNAMAVKIGTDLGHEGIAVTHDSPVRHEGKFDWRKHAGKGEGAMAVGAGTYFSTDDSVHRHYKGKFNADIDASFEVVSDPKGWTEVDVARNKEGNPREVYTDGGNQLVMHTDGTWVFHDANTDIWHDVGKAKSLEEAVHKLMELSKQAKKRAPSYHGVIDAKPEEIMDWNAPLSEQSEYVQKALRSLGFDAPADKVDWERNGARLTGYREDGTAFEIAPSLDEPGKYALTNLDADQLVDYFESEAHAKAYLSGHDLTGAMMYRNLSTAMGGDREASDALQKAGIVGHKYAAGAAGGRKPKDLNPNYVVYDDNRVKTLFVEFSNMDVGKGPVSEEQRKEVRDYVEKVLGKDAKVLFAKMAHAGEFAKLGAEEVLKIAIDAIDPMSVGHHEALHAFFSRLIKADEAAAKTLLRAASAAPVVARLKELLKAHPNALKQLTAEGQKQLDPTLSDVEAEREAAEERLAYMYQFWASGKKGLLTVGPETKGWFDKVKAFIRVLLGLWADEMNSALDAEKTSAILDAFHNGAFADKNTVAKVLTERFPKDPRETMDKAFPAISRIANKFLWTAQGAVRDMNLGPLNEIMDKFHLATDASGKDAGWLQAKHAEHNKRVNKVVSALRDMTEAEQKRVLADLRSGLPRTHPAALAIEDVLREALTYMRGAGVKEVDGYEVVNGKVKMTYRDVHGIEKSYFPRVFDHDAVRKQRDAFIALLEKHGVGEGDPMKNPDSERADLWEKLAKGVTDANPRSDAVLGVTLFTPNIKMRKMNDIPDAELAPFLNQDLFGTMSIYLARAARRAEYARRFGNSGERIDAAVDKAKELGMTASQERTFKDSVHAMEGTLGSNMSDGLRQAYGAITTYQNFRLLPLALFSSLVDPLGIAVRGGTMKEAFDGLWRGISDLAKLKEDDAYTLAKTVGAINAANDAQVVGDMYSSQFMSGRLRQWNEKFFKYNGMESWNRSMRVAASAAAEQFIIRHVEKPTEDSTRYLKELNLEKGDVLIQDGKITLNKKTEDAINLWVDQAIIRPNAANRPIYMSDPNWILVSHLKQYTYMFQKVILARVYHELQHGNPQPMLVLAGYVPMIIASDMLRVALTPGQGDDQYRAGWTAKDWIWRGIQRAGLFGPGQFALDAGAGGSSFEGLAGPSVQQLSEFVKGSMKGQIGTELLRAVPGARQLVM